MGINTRGSSHLIETIHWIQPCYEKFVWKHMYHPWNVVYHWIEIPMLWEKSSIEKVMHFPCYKANHRMGIWLKRTSLTFRLSPQDVFYCIFWWHGILMESPMYFPCDGVYHKIGIWSKRSTHTLGKVWVPISQAPSMVWVLLDFLMLWDIDGETHAFYLW